MCHVVIQSGLRGIIPLRNLLAPYWPAGIAICCCETRDQRQPPSPMSFYSSAKLQHLQHFFDRVFISRPVCESSPDFCQTTRRANDSLREAQCVVSRLLSVQRGRRAEASVSARLGFTPATAVEKSRSEEAVLSQASRSSHMICFHCAALVPCTASVYVSFHAHVPLCDTSKAIFSTCDWL